LQVKRGYGKVNIEAMKFVFGTWNDRVLEESGITNIITNALQVSLNNMMAKCTILIIITSKELNFSTLFAEGNVSDSMPILEFKDGVDTLIAASGQHQFKAHEWLKQMCMKGISKAEQKLLRHRDGGKTKMGDDEVEALEKEMK
jgi:hypothetical protein